MNYDQINLKEEFQKMPEKLREALISVDKVKAFSEVREKYKIHVDQAGILAREIDLVLMGFVPTKDFTERLKEKIGADDEKARKIAKDVDEKIFIKIRENLKEATSEPIENELKEERVGEESYKKEILGETEDKTGEKQEPTRVEEENLNKEDILREIENEPVDMDQTEGLKTPGETRNKDFLKGNVEAQTPLINKDGGTKPDMGKEMFEDKLTTPVKVKEESQEKDEDTKKSLGRKTYKGRLDPYREPID